MRFAICDLRLLGEEMKKEIKNDGSSVGGETRERVGIILYYIKLLLLGG